MLFVLFDSFVLHLFWYLCLCCLVVLFILLLVSLNLLIDCGAADAWVGAEWFLSIVNSVVLIGYFIVFGVVVSVLLLLFICFS